MAKMRLIVYEDGEPFAIATYHPDRDTLIYNDRARAIMVRIEAQGEDGAWREFWLHEEPRHYPTGYITFPPISLA